MADALYGPGGFYRGESVPPRHFRTSAHVSNPDGVSPWVDAWRQLATLVDDMLGQPDPFDVVEVGAGAVSC